MSRASFGKAVERVASSSKLTNVPSYFKPKSRLAILSYGPKERNVSMRLDACIRQLSLPSQLRSYATQTLKFQQSAISPEDYQKLSDDVFDNLTDYLEELTQEYDGEDAEDYEVEYSSGVLNLRLADHGTYVINKQPANKQIWFSSPTSGPKRFDYDSKEKAWFMLKEGEEWNMRDLLNRELGKIFNKKVEVNLGER